MPPTRSVSSHSCDLIVVAVGIVTSKHQFKVDVHRAEFSIYAHKILSRSVNSESSHILD